MVNMVTLRRKCAALRINWVHDETKNTKQKASGMDIQDQMDRMQIIKKPVASRINKFFRGEDVYDGVLEGMQEWHDKYTAPISMHKSETPACAAPTSDNPKNSRPPFWKSQLELQSGCRFFFMHVKYTKHARTWRVVTYLAYLKKAYFLTCPLWLFLLFRNVEHAFENAVFVFGVFGVLQRTWRVATYLTYLTKKRHPQCKCKQPAS